MKSKQSKRRDRRFVKKLLLSFHDCATFFTFSIQIASIVVLARVDYGISATSMGDTTVKITWSVSVLTLLPLLYALILVDMDDSDTDSSKLVDVKAASLEATSRFLLFVVCWTLSMYPFMSRMIETFGTSLIGDGPKDAISDHDWNVLENICLTGTSAPTNAESRIINTFGIMASLILSIFAVSNICLVGLQRHYPDIAHKVIRAIQKTKGAKRWSRLALIVTIPFLSIGLIWSFFRLQRFQYRISASANVQDSDEQWTFGQIVSVAVFAPVLVEGTRNWYERGESSDAEGGEDEEDIENKEDAEDAGAPLFELMQDAEMESRKRRRETR